MLLCSGNPSVRAMNGRVWVAANRGDIGGGEVMLLRLVDVLRELGLDAALVAPESPGDLVEAGMAAGLPLTVIPGVDRRSYGRSLRRWDKRRASTDILWCNGLLPAFATTGHRRRIIHLHQLPGGAQVPASRIAAAGAVAIVVPSLFMRSRLHQRRAVEVMPNWTDAVSLRPARQVPTRLTIGFLGRVSVAKGVDVLARAVSALPSSTRARIQLLVAGDDRFVPSEDRTTVDSALAAVDVPVRRAGWVSRDDFFNSADIAVVPSVRPESFGLTAVEAMAAGVPLVVTDAGALPEVVGPGYPWIATAGDHRSMARTLHDAIEALPATAEVHAARLRWKAAYSPQAGQQTVAAVASSVGMLDARTSVSDAHHR